jgi:hypothetical protein
MGLDPAQIQRHLRATAAANNSDAQGKAYETLAVTSLNQCPAVLWNETSLAFLAPNKSTLP